jgi:integrase
MPTVKLTQHNVERLPGPADGAREVTFWDAELTGLGLRVLASGSRSWLVRYRVERTGRQQFKSLGSVRVLDLAAARKAAKKLLAAVETGSDPRVEHTAERQRAAETLAKLVALYVARHVEPHQRPRSALETRRALEVHFKPLHDRPVVTLTKRDVAARLAQLAITSGPVAANRARAALSALFSWAMKQGLADGNPVVGTAKAVAEKALERHRRLTDAEIVAVWRATDGPGDYNAIVRLLLLTGQRREEVAAMRWQELDLDRALWMLPKERTKNKRPHELPLSAQALAILGAHPRREGRELVFGEGEGGYSGWSLAKARLDARLAAAQRAPLPAWRLHDLRRTAVTGMAGIGILPHVIEAVVNHVSGHKGGVAGVYNHAEYAPEKRQALDRWGAHVAALAAGAPSKVVPLRTVAG